MGYFKYCLWLLVCINVMQPNVTAYKILGIFVSPSNSHTILGTELLKSLAERGHGVTMVSGYPQKTPMTNYRDITVSFDLKEVSFNLTGKIKYYEKEQNSGGVTVLKLFQAGLTVTELILRDQNIQNLLNSNEHFDAVIVLTMTYEATYAIANHFKAPLIVYTQVAPTMLTSALVGNPNNFAYVPDWFLGYSDRMTFMQRVLNTMVGIFFELLRNLYYLPIQNEITKKLFPNGPDLYEIMKNVSLILSNSHSSLSYPKPLMPNIIEIGGHHVKEPKPLPRDIQKYMDEAEHGVIYFSLGSNIRSKDLNLGLRNIIMKVFAKLPQKILWKWEDDDLSGKPDNVFISKWFPQTDILAHPNIKLFITHGGWGSILETIIRGVPLIGIPGLGDQHVHVGRAATMGFGILLDFTNITEISFSWAINEILHNPKYKEEMKKRSALFLDREIQPVDRAIYWIEYVIRNKGAYHLQSAAVQLNYFQYLLLDVMALFVIVFAVIILIFYCSCKHFVRKLCKSKSKTLQQKKTN